MPTPLYNQSKITINDTVKIALFTLLVLAALSSVPPAVQGLADITLSLNKPAYSPNERIEAYGTLLVDAAPSSGTTVTLTVGSTSYSLTTGSDGAFYSRSDLYPSATLVTAPSSTGSYNVTATYSVAASVPITVVAQTIDAVVLSPDKGSYYPGQAVLLTAYAWNSGNPVNGSPVNVTLSNSSDGSPVSSFSCTTGAGGSCTASLTAPASPGRYIFQSTDGLGYGIMFVVPYEVNVFVKDSTLTADQFLFKRGDAGYVQVVVTYNSTTPTGTYSASGQILDAGGAAVASLSSQELSENNSYVTNLPFTVTSSFSTGNYRALVNVTKSGGSNASKHSSYFEVRDWVLTVEKASPNSGFEYGYTAFQNTTVFFNAFPTDKSTSNTIAGLANNFTITLKNTLGVNVSNASASYNSPCACYKFNLTTPLIAGTYALSVSVFYNETQTVEKTILVTNLTASARTTDVSGSGRDAFALEPIYIRPSLANATNGSFAPSDAELISVVFENGSSYSYTNVSNWSMVNITNDILEWSYNSSTRMIKMDSPRMGGLYWVQISLDSRSYLAETQFIRKPYFIRASFKNSNDVSVATDYWWQFKTTDTVYAHLSIVETDVNSITNLTQSGNASGGGIWGTGSAPKLNTNTEKAVSNATITMRVTHGETGKGETLNSTSGCTATSTQGKYICTLKPNSTSWSAGDLLVEFTVRGQDGTTDSGIGVFEARSFYVYGWSQNWRNRPNSTVTLNVNAYVAGSNWWSSKSGGGISGTAALEKVLYLGTGEFWLRSPVKYDYNTTNMNSTSLSNGQGTMSLPSSRAPNATWKSGSYMAFVKVTEASSGTVDYGQVWFDIRNWDVWAQPVEITGGNIQYKWEYNNYENASLYVIINNAGEWGTSGSSLGGDVVVSVKSIKNYISWPPADMNSSSYRANNITVSQSNSYFWGNAISGTTYGNYLINISPVSGKWDSGYYSLILDVNGTETGYGWFSAIAFHVSTSPVDVNGSYSYASRGNGPLFFLIETTKNNRWGSAYAVSDYVNSTLKSLTLRRYDPVTYQQVEYSYPRDLNVSFLNNSGLMTNGTGTLNISLANATTWPSGYYSGQIVMHDSNGSIGTGWLWVSVQPFRTHFGPPNAYNNPSVGLTSNLSGEFGVYDPNWNTWTILEGNYTIAGIVHEEWSMGGLTTTPITTYQPNQSFAGNTTLNASAPSGGWPGSGPWKNIRPTVRDSANATDVGYINFRAVPASLSIAITSDYNIPFTANATINITVRDPNNASLGAAVNLTSMEEYVWNPSTSQSAYYTYGFRVGSCASGSTGGCLVNSTNATGGVKPVSVTIIPPAAGWPDGYHNPTPYFSPPQAQGTYSVWDLCDWNAGSCSFYFRASDPITGYSYPLSSKIGATSNLTIYLYSLRYLNGTTATVNVTNVQYAIQNGNCFSDACRVYANIPFNVSDSLGTPTGKNNITDWGYLTLFPPSGGYQTGSYYVKIFIQSGSENATIKDSFFSIIDTNPPALAISTPVLGTVINTSVSGSLVISATTNENSVCSAEIWSYTNFHNSYCGNVTAPYCNSSYTGGSYYYFYITAWCYAGANCMTTGGTTHTYTHALSGLANQDYAVRYQCWDSDWNYATNATVFTITGSSAQSNATTNLTIPAVTLSYPANDSINTSTNITFAWFSTANASNYTFQLSNASSFSPLLNSTNTSLFKINISNLTDNQTYYWRVRGYNGTSVGNFSPVWQVTVNTSYSSPSNASVGTVALSSPPDASTNYSSTITFIWQSATNASNYTFQISNASDVSSPNYTTNTSLLNVTVANLSWITYYWRVRGFNGTVWGNWSPIWTLILQQNVSVEVGNVTLLSPANASTNTSNTIAFTWQSAGNATNYTFQLSNVSDFATLRNDSNTSSTSITIAGLANQTTYYWRVRGFNGSSVGIFSAPWQFIIAPNSAPAWSSAGKNATAAGSAVLFFSYWTDDANLSGFIFSTNNTGAWVNDSWASFTGTANWSNVTKILNSTVNISIGWMIYANDSSNAWNTTGIQSFTTT
ncbi:MAG: hypothetical protein HY520_03845 [Candidatus Aenigmarchaeota archaeon]|nr:hypothetical protein [Candidatus Aenigmarchaeota archaeon]